MRTIAALYDSRAEAETAHARLTAEVKADQVRIISQDTVAALSSYNLAAADADRYRQGLKAGAVLLVGNVATGEEADRIVRILELSNPGRGDRAGVADQARGSGTVTDQVAVPLVEEELRIGKREVTRGGAQVRSFTREEPAQQDVTLKQDRVEHETRAVDRRLTVEEVQRGGLLKERVIEVSEMREEPIVTKEAFVREEVVLTRTVTERVETIHDTVRRTQVEVEELTGGEVKDRPR